MEVDSEKPSAAATQSVAERPVREMMETMPLLSVMLDREGTILFANPFLLKLTGWTQEEVLGKNWFTIFSSPGDSNTWGGSFNSMIKGAPLPGFKGSIVTRGGEKRDVSWNNAYWHDSKGSVAGVFSIGKDITDRNELDRQALDALNYKQMLVEKSPVGIITYRASGEAVSANPAAAKIVGSSPQIIAKQNFRSLPSWEASGLLAAAERAFASGQPQQLEAHTLSTFGKEAWLFAQMIPFEYGGETQLLAILDNVTSRKQAERALKESEERFRQLAENIRQVFWISSKDTGELLYVSPAYEEIWGRSRDSLHGDPLSFTEAIHSEDRDKALKALAHQKKEGGYDVQYRIIRPDGSVRWIHDQGFAVRNERGQIYRSVGLADDITNRKTLESQFRQAQKMEAVGQLAGGVAHDFNNILSAILLHLGVLRQNPEIAAEVKESLQDLETEAVRASGLTRQLLLFSRRQVARVEPLVVEELIKGLLKMLRRLLGENIEMDLVASTVPSCVEADPGMLEQVVMNLCVNARDAMPNGGKITLRTSLIAIDRKSPHLHPDSYEGRFMCLEVTDTGCGMEENVLRRMFEPFFTTKEAGKGTGLGLATVYGIVKQHKGWLQVESVVGKGTTFRAYIPEFSAPVRALKPKVVEKDLPRGLETVLLVEDDAALRRVTSMCLQKLGYTVIEATDGADALQKWAAHKSNIDLLLTDMVMPETITGLNLTQRLQVDNPKLKAIISSGYSSELVKPQVLKKGIVFLPKPYRPSVLSKIVRQCLDGK